MINAQLLLSGVVFGLSIGSIYFLLAIGLSLCFGLMRIISLDQLLYYSIGAYITYSINLVTGSLWLGVLAGMAVAGLASFAVERFIFLRIYARDPTFSMITSFGILIGGIGIIKYFWGVVPRPVEVPTLIQVAILGTEVPVYRLIVIGIAGAVYIGIWLFLHRTIVGKAIRAAIEDVEHVEGLGINVSRLFTITFIIAGSLSGLPHLRLAGTAMSICFGWARRRFAMWPTKSPIATAPPSRGLKRRSSATEVTVRPR